MRTIVIVLFLILFLLFEIPFMGVMWIYGKINRQKSDLIQLRVVQWAFKVVMFLAGTRLIVLGQENIPKEEAVFYIGNHRGFWDVVSTYALCPARTGYISKKSIRKVPVLGMVMSRLSCLFIDRDDLKQSLQVILTAIDYIKDGISICLFPEGTRNKDADHPESLLPFKDGSFKIAQKTNCKIIPMAISGSDDVLENHFPWVKKTTVVICYGEPIQISELDKATQKHMGAYVQEKVQILLNQAVDERMHGI